MNSDTVHRNADGSLGLAMGFVGPFFTFIANHFDALSQGTTYVVLVISGVGALYGAKRMRTSAKIAELKLKRLEEATRVVDRSIHNVPATVTPAHPLNIEEDDEI